MKLPWLALARALWIALAVGYLAIWLVSLPEYYTRVSTLTVEPFILGERVILDNAAALAEATQRGVSLENSAALTIGLALLQVLVFYLVATVILVRTQNGFGWFTALVLMLFSVNIMERAVGVAQPFPGALLWTIIPTYIVWPMWMFWLVLFPNGYPVPRRGFIIFELVVGLLFLIQVSSVLAVAGLVPARVDTIAASSPVLALPLFGFVLFSQIYRYVRVSNFVERQQAKWFLFGVGIFFAGLVAFLIVPDLFRTSLVVQGFFSTVFLFFPVAVALAILRYRLFDIDILIRRTVTYSLLTALLLAVYFGLVIVMQQLLRAVTGQNSELAIIVSTLAIALLFVPLRTRVQNVLDKRFYRRKYDAQKVLAQFAQTARDETDLDKLTDELIRVVDETMQPESVELWLKKTDERKRRTDK